MGLIKNGVHCIRAAKVYDWVIQPVELTLTNIINDKQLPVSDFVEGKINIPCGDRTLIWCAAHSLSVSGSVSIYHSTMSGCLQIEVLVNGEPAFSVPKGQSRSITVLHLQSVEVRCLSGTDFCLANYCIDLHVESCRTISLCYI